jgi:hypothetical protein
MRNCPGISWGYDSHINLIRSSIGWLALYYDDPESTPEIIKIFKPKNHFDYYQMMDKVAFYNYNTCVLCPMVKLDMDYTS